MAIRISLREYRTLKEAEKQLKQLKQAHDEAARTWKKPIKPKLLKKNTG